MKKFLTNMKERMGAAYKVLTVPFIVALATALGYGLFWACSRLFSTVKDLMGLILPWLGKNWLILLAIWGVLIAVTWARGSADFKKSIQNRKKRREEEREKERRAAEAEAERRREAEEAERRRAAAEARAREEAARKAEAERKKKAELLEKLNGLSPEDLEALLHSAKSAESPAKPEASSGDVPFSMFVD